VSKLHISKVGSAVADNYDSISFGEQIFVEEMLQKDIPSDYQIIDNSYKREAKLFEENSISRISLDGFLKVLIRVFAVSAIIFILFSLFGGLLDRSEMASEPLGREAGITFGLFASIVIFTILFLFTKTKIKISIENGLLHIKSFRGINHAIPLESIADCRINIFKNANSIKTFLTSKSYKIDLEAGMLITFKDGNNLLIASSNTYQSNKKLVFN